MSATWIGVTAYRDAESGLVKQGALLFDQLITSEWDDEGRRDVIDWLLELGVIRSTFQNSIYNVDDDRTYRNVKPRAGFEAVAASDKSSTTPALTFNDVRDELSRGFAGFYGAILPDATVIPLVDKLRSSGETRESSVLRVVINELPLPSVNTSWDAILEWRGDEEAKTRYRRLRKWINELCRGELSPHHIQDEIATMIDDYRTYMSKHHRLMARSRWEVVATTCAEVGEELAKVRLSAIVQRLFGLFKEEIPLLETELDAPGREIAYLVHARERFI